MDGLLDIVRRVVAQELQRVRSNLLGVVTAVHAHDSADDDNNFEADVKLKHVDLELHRPVAQAVRELFGPEVRRPGIRVQIPHVKRK